MVLSEDSLVGWVTSQCRGVGRYVLGVAGPPGSGKSTLAARVGAALGAPVVAMDGFHRSNADLFARGQQGIKGAPETFEAEAFVDLVRRLRDPADEVWCPGFDRRVDEPVPDRVRVGVDDELVIVEGNYLLLDEHPWRLLGDLFSAVVYLDLPFDVRMRRLVERHVEFGKVFDDAAAFVERSDAVNARLVEAGRPRATVHVAMIHE